MTCRNTPTSIDALGYKVPRTGASTVQAPFHPKTSTTPFRLHCCHVLPPPGEQPSGRGHWLPSPPPVTPGATLLGCRGTMYTLQFSPYGLRLVPAPGGATRPFQLLVPKGGVQTNTSDFNPVFSPPESRPVDFSGTIPLLFQDSFAIRAPTCSFSHQRTPLFSTTKGRRAGERDHRSAASEMKEQSHPSHDQKVCRQTPDRGSRISNPFKAARWRSTSQVNFQRFLAGGRDSVTSLRM